MLIHSHGGLRTILSSVVFVN